MPTKSAAPPIDDAPARPKRLTAAARRSSILQAARRAFTETGDMNGTTIRHIAERGGISEGVIYRHFESKDQLFYEAVVEPLRVAVDDLVAATDAIDREQPLTKARQRDALEDLYRELASTFVEVLPLLGLVLFGDPKVAGRFYRESFTVLMDRLVGAWQNVGKRYGREDADLDVAARAIMGMALVLALESHHKPDFDRDRAVALVADGTLTGFFPGYAGSRRGRR